MSSQCSHRLTAKSSQVHYFGSACGWQKKLIDDIHINLHTLYIECRTWVRFGKPVWPILVCAPWPCALCAFENHVEVSFVSLIILAVRINPGSFSYCDVALKSCRFAARMSKSSLPLASRFRHKSTSFA